jgi:hypothetical protein
MWPCRAEAKIAKLTAVVALAHAPLCNTGWPWRVAL